MLIDFPRGRLPLTAGDRLLEIERKKKAERDLVSLLQAELPPPQPGPQKTFIETPADIAIYGGAAYSGKGGRASIIGYMLRHGMDAQSVPDKIKETEGKVLTLSGFTNFSEIAYGDRIMNPDGSVQSVIGVFDRGFMPFFRVEFTDGARVDVSGDHLWGCWVQSDSFTLSENWNENYFQRAEIATTEQLIKRLDEGQTILTPMCAPSIFQGEKQICSSQIWEDGRAIASITPIEEDFCRCIQVSSPNSLYITDDYVVTHNSYGLLLSLGELAKNPVFRGVCFRRTSPQITNEGGLFDTAGELYRTIGAKPFYTTHEYRFLSGATVRFSHLQLERTKYEWQGSQLDLLAFDELTHFTESQFFYLLSRVRSPSGLPTKIRGTTNPDAESWVAKLIAWWVGDEGYPDPQKAGKVRWFIREENDLVWGDSWEELHEAMPEKVAAPGDYLSERISPLSLTFIPGSIYDNKLGLDADPTYMAKLHSLHPVERERLLRGNWMIKFSTGLVFSRAWFTIIEAEAAPRTGRTCRYWDIAATAKELASDRHYYTAGTKMRRSGDRITVLHSLWDQVGPADVERLIINTAKSDGRNCLVRFELEGGSNAKIFAEALKKKLRQLGFNADYNAPRGDKLTRALPYATAAGNNLVEIVQGLGEAPWHETYLDCCQQFDGSKRPLISDVIDSSSGCFDVLMKGASQKPPVNPKQRNLKKSRVF